MNDDVFHEDSFLKNWGGNIFQDVFCLIEFANRQTIKLVLYILMKNVSNQENNPKAFHHTDTVLSVLRAFSNHLQRLIKLLDTKLFTRSRDLLWLII